MLQPSVERPVKFETLVGNLLERDLKGVLVHTSRWEGVTSFFTRRPKTYHAVTGQPHKARLMEALLRGKVLAEADVLSLQAGKSQIPDIDQLALSSQPRETVKALTRGGLGAWPVPEGVDLGVVNTRRLGMNLSTEQADFLDRNQGVVAKPSTLWVDGRRLLRDTSPLEVDYLPTAPEILFAILLYKTQEGVFPDSKGKWLLTGSKATLSVKDAYERAFVDSEAKDLFIEACIQSSKHQEMIRKHLAVLGDFTTTEPDYLTASRTGNQYSLLYGSGKVVEFQITGNQSANVDLGDYKRLLLQDGMVKVVYGNAELVEYSSPYETVLREINRERQLGVNIWDRALGLPIVLSVDPKTGVRIGLLDNIDKQQTRWSLAGGYLHLDTWPTLKREIDRRTGGLEIIPQASWPMTIPDSLADQLLRR